MVRGEDYYLFLPIVFTENRKLKTDTSIPEDPFSPNLPGDQEALPMSAIKFGTSGWRGILAEDFTCDNIRLLCQAIAAYLKQVNLAARG